MTAAPRRSASSAKLSAEPLAGLLGGGRIPGRPPGILGRLADLLTSPPPSTGPCFDKPKGMRGTSR